MKKYLPYFLLIVAIVSFSLWFFAFRTPAGIEVKGNESNFSSIASIIVGTLSLVTSVIALISNVITLKAKK